MATLTLRSVKGSPLTNSEVDGNFTSLNNELAQKLNATSYTAADVLAKLLTVDGSGSGIDADLLDGLTTATTNTANTAVTRNGTGGFAAGTITATGFTGPLTGAVTGNVTGNVSGTASGLSTTLAIGSGGTGATTVTAARTNLGLGSLALQNSNAVAITGGTISTLTNDLAIADGGTGASNAAAARINLGLTIGTDVQAFDADLSALAGVSTNGFFVRVANSVAASRSITTTSSNIVIVNGDGVAANPQISIVASPQFTSLGVGTTASGIAGEIRATGDVVSAFSDDRLKDNLGLIENALDKLCSLSGFYYKPNEIAQDLGYTPVKSVGVSAQQVQAVLPEVVAPAPIDDKYLTVHYEKLIPLVIEAIKELRAEVQNLKQ